MLERKLDKNSLAHPQIPKLTKFLFIGQSLVFSDFENRHKNVYFTF